VLILPTTIPTIEARRVACLEEGHAGERPRPIIAPNYSWSMPLGKHHRSGRRCCGARNYSVRAVLAKGRAGRSIARLGKVDCGRLDCAIAPSDLIMATGRKATTIMGSNSNSRWRRNPEGAGGNDISSSQYQLLNLAERTLHA